MLKPRWLVIIILSANATMLTYAQDKYDAKDFFGAPNPQGIIDIADYLAPPTVAVWSVRRPDHVLERLQRRIPFLHAALHIGNTLPDQARGEISSDGPAQAAVAHHHCCNLLIL